MGPPRGPSFSHPSPERPKRAQFEQRAAPQTPPRQKGSTRASSPGAPSQPKSLRPGMPQWAVQEPGPVRSCRAHRRQKQGSAAPHRAVRPQRLGATFNATAEPAPQSSPRPRLAPASAQQLLLHRCPAGAQPTAKQRRGSGAAGQVQAQARPSGAGSRRAPTSPKPGMCRSTVICNNTSSQGSAVSAAPTGEMQD
ncbi:hypothetical protein NDU88_005432 [Pleurodeles waltl]|uniref:Uncharacterized protein n=1 Tax=Pleurodeles waltl TaxID=8319 RepID=A0AAV7W7T4_PLEWA|nr:hypothetical protein NDU88_005432 [Pleurodeles waltl]